MRLINRSISICFLLFLLLLTSCGGYQTLSPDDPNAVLTASTTSTLAGEEVLLDASASIYDSNRWEVNGRPFGACEGSDMCPFPTPTPGVFEVTFYAITKSATEELTSEASVVIEVLPNTGNSHTAVHTVGNPLDDFHRTIPKTGENTFIEMYQDGAGGGDELANAAGVATSPDNKHVYVTGFADDAIAVFSRNTSDGTLTFDKDSANLNDGLDGAAYVVVSPDNKNVYVSGKEEDALSVYSRNLDDGTLTFVEIHRDGHNLVNGLDGIWGIAISPDNKHVYTSGSSDNAVAVFSRDLDDGTLTFVTSYHDVADVADGLSLSFYLTVGPNGEYVYAAGFTDNALIVFSRNPSNGTLTEVDLLKNGDGEVTGLSGAYVPVVSPDNKHVYLTGYLSDSVSAFSRNSDGTLSFVDTYQNGGGIDGLDGALGIQVSPDNLHVYVAGNQDAGMAVFSRNTSDGSLSFKQAYNDGEGNIDGLDGAWGISIAPDNNHVYITGYTDNAVSVFSRD